MNDLLHQKCVPCEGGTPPLTADEIQKYKASLKQNWLILDSKKIWKEFRFKNFRTAIAFIDKVAVLAESEGHHLDIYIFYDKVKFELWTHSIGGLSTNDFIMAAKIESLDGYLS